MKWCLRALVVCVLATVACGPMESEPTRAEEQARQEPTVEAQKALPPTEPSQCGDSLVCGSGEICCQSSFGDYYCVAEHTLCYR